MGRGPWGVGVRLLCDNGTDGVGGVASVAVGRCGL
jgi:hypothetical protein